jgi:hypothetical protein
MSIKKTTDSFEWIQRNACGVQGKNGVEIDVATTITHDTVALAVYVLPNASWNCLHDVEICMSHEEAIALADALKKAVNS